VATHTSHWGWVAMHLSTSSGWCGLQGYWESTGKPGHYSTLSVTLSLPLIGNDGVTKGVLQWLHAAVGQHCVG